MPWLVHIVACLAIGAVWASWSAMLEYTTNPYAYDHPDAFGVLWQSRFFGNPVGYFMLYGAVVVLSAAFDAHSRLLHQRTASAQLSELLAQAQLSALRLQLEPHFIFNALNAVTALIREKKDEEAVATVAALGDLLRRVTDSSERQFVTMEEEIDFVCKYLEIQQLRFAERLRYRIDVPATLMQAQVPDFIFQPLVENAIKHGIAKRSRGGELLVAAACDGVTLTLSVCNDGPPLREPIHEGVGLANTRQRLLALYGSKPALRLQNHAGSGVLATIDLPYCVH